jgi:hypothetical protein
MPQETAAAATCHSVLQARRLLQQASCAQHRDYDLKILISVGLYAPGIVRTLRDDVGLGSA